MNKTKLMAILNTTPDSFYAPSRTFFPEVAIERGIRLWEEGADILDIGGESTRPGADPVSTEEELKRVIPVINGLAKRVPIPISIDTYKPIVAKAAIDAGATFINDVTGLIDPQMVTIAAATKSDVCIMHMLGNPQTMQNSPYYEKGIMTFLTEWFRKRMTFLLNNGIEQNKIILDPGIGFGKTVQDNLEIIKHLTELKKLGPRILLGISRKSFMSKIIGKDRPELLATTLGINTLAIMAGLDIIRVHDVAEHRDLIDVLEAVRSKENSC